MAPRTLVLVLAVLLAACASRSPRVAVGSLDGLDAFLSGHPLAAGQPIRADLVGRTATASYHLVQVRGGEAPHRHVAHDLTVFVLRGHGTLTLGEHAIELAAGDAVVVPRGEVHWFARSGAGTAVALVTFTPPLDAPDHVPADVR